MKRVIQCPDCDRAFIADVWPDWRIPFQCRQCNPRPQRVRQQQALVKRGILDMSVTLYADSILREAGRG